MPGFTKGQNDDGLDYCLTFPKSKFSADPKRPLAILLGWAGSEDRHLAKYAGLYEKLGFYTLRHTMKPHSLVTYNYPDIQKTAKQIIKLIFQFNLDNSPIVFHVFSTGGTMLYRAVTEEVLKVKKLKMLVSAVVYDSAPGCMSLVSLYYLILGAIGGNGEQITRCVAAFILMLVSILCLLYRLVVMRMKGEVSSWFSALEQSDADWPEFYIYSICDDVVSSLDVETMMTSRKQLGVRIGVLKLDFSNHLEHLITYPSEYQEAVESFMESVHGVVTTRRRKHEAAY